MEPTSPLESAGKAAPWCDPCRELAEALAARLRPLPPPLAITSLTSGLGGFVTLVRIMHSNGPDLPAKRFTALRYLRCESCSKPLLDGLQNDGTCDCGSHTWVSDPP